MHAFLILALALWPDASAPRRMWRPPAQTTLSDWIWGPGGAERAPRPPFHFVRENLGGTNPKIDVRDARGALWTVKFGGEVHSETFASRLLYAAGYAVEPVYYVREGAVVGAHGLKRARPFLSRGGHFTNARFKLRDGAALAYADGLQWSWIDNPFLGSRELSGLKILMMLVSNWDAKDARDGRGSNTAVFVDGGTYLYGFTDWGSAMGRWGGFFQRSRWDSGRYRRQSRRFVRDAGGGRLVWGFRGKHGGDIAGGIAVEDVRWLVPYLSRITDEQLRAGLASSGATQAEAVTFTSAIRARITRLERIAGMQ
jgi:hypothetical protein